MNIRKEIDQFSNSIDKPILHWLLDKYHLQSQWNFVATCSHQRYGTQSYETNRIWSPTTEGRIIYTHYQKERRRKK